MNDPNIYASPLSSRYASKEMLYLFSSQFKHRTWRRLWVSLAKAQKALGLSITDKQIKLLEENIDNIDFAKAAEYEKKTHHDVMAHIHAYGDVCPEAKGIIHWGATSCYVTDNTDILQMLDGLIILRTKLTNLISSLSSFAQKHANLACLSFTHLQPAQPTTVGKRACLWIQEFLMDLKDIEHRIQHIKFLGAKGATGTQASFLFLFEGDHEKVKKLEDLIAKDMGLTSLFPISGQTYTRKQEMQVFAPLSGLAASAHKFATDLRLLAHMKEIEEPFHSTQVGSSAMPYKRNPIHSERVCSLARFLISLQENPSYTASLQWLERSLDDSANRRIVIPEAFLTADAILQLLLDIASGLVVHPKMIEKHLQDELPFMATEDILLAAVKKGKDRQQVHQKLRELCMQASNHMKEGKECDLLDRIQKDPAIGLSEKELKDIVQVERFVGRAPEQVKEFLSKEVEPFLKKLEEKK